MILLYVDDNNHITGYADICEDDGILYEGNVPEGFWNNPAIYDFIDGAIIPNEGRCLSDLIEKIRVRRENECFKICDRSIFWYESLTQSQLEELKNWRNAWLDATTTLVIPEKPEWL